MEGRDKSIFRRFALDVYPYLKIRSGATQYLCYYHILWIIWYL